MKWPTFKSKKRHLKYTSVASWLHGESVPRNFAVEYGSGRRPDYKIYMDQFCELRQHLFEKHVLTLSKNCQDQLRNGEHPSFAHSKVDQAEPVLKRLRAILSSHTKVREIRIKTAQMGRVQFNVILKDEPTLEEAEMIPEYFEGYIVNTCWTRKGEQGDSAKV